MTRFGGGCLCGQVTYEIVGDPITTLICYCRQCQLAAGAERADGIVIDASAFRLVQGSLKEHQSLADSGHVTKRTFCGSCGTHIGAVSLRRPEIMSVRTMTLDEPGRFAPEVAIFTAFAQPWSKITEGIPTYATTPA